jgi:hypothetical protein
MYITDYWHSKMDRDGAQMTSGPSIFLGIACALLVTIFHRASAQVLSRPPQATIENGNLTYGDLTTTVQTPAVTDTFVVSYATFDPTKLRMGLVQPQDSSDGSSLLRLIQDAKAIGIMNGGFLNSMSPATPAGFLKIKEVLNGGALDKVADGFICFSRELSPGAVVIGRYADLESTAASYPDCVQGGPLLVKFGKKLPNLEPLDDDATLKRFSIVAAVRSFLAKTKSGNIVMGVTTPVSLYSLRTVLLQKQSDGGFEVNEAIALTGRTTAGLIVGSGFSRGSPKTLLPDAIIVRR